MPRVPIHIKTGFPVGGLYLSSPTSEQPPSTTLDCMNVRAFEPSTGRNRGGQREGITKYNTNQVSGSNRIQSINHVTTVQTGATAATALNFRTINLVAVSNGDIAKVTSSAVTTATGGTGALDSAAPVIFSAPLFGVNYYGDGSSYVKWDAATNTASTWTASAGTLPTGGSDSCRLVERWQGRIILSGLESDPHNIFGSAIGDAEGWDYAPDPEVETQAFAANLSPFGLIGDVVTALAPYTDDLLVIGCDHSIHLLRGNPISGGRVELVSNSVGMAYGRPYCMGPNGRLFFFSSFGGIYSLIPGAHPDRITANSIERELRQIDLNQNIIRLAYDDRGIGIYVFITPLDSSRLSTHYYYDLRNNAWFRDEFPADLNPVAVHQFDGDLFGDRTLLIGSEDGYIRRFDVAARDDDSTAINSEVWIGPIQVENGTVPFILADIEACLADGSDDVEFEVYGLDCSEDLNQISSVLTTEGGDELLTEDGTAVLAIEGVFFDSTALLTEAGDILITEDNFTLSTENDPTPIENANTFQGTFKAGQSVNHQPRVRGRSVYIKLYNDTAAEGWGLEWIHCKLNAIQTSDRRG